MAKVGKCQAAVPSVAKFRHPSLTFVKVKAYRRQALGLPITEPRQITFKQVSTKKLFALTFALLSHSLIGANNRYLKSISFFIKCTMMIVRSSKNRIPFNIENPEP